MTEEKMRSVENVNLTLFDEQLYTKPKRDTSGFVSLGSAEDREQ